MNLTLTSFRQRSHDNSVFITSDWTEDGTNNLTNNITNSYDQALLYDQTVLDLEDRLLTYIYKKLTPESTDLGITPFFIKGSNILAGNTGNMIILQPNDLTLRSKNGSGYKYFVHTNLMIETGLEYFIRSMKEEADYRSNTANVHDDRRIIALLWITDLWLARGEYQTNLIGEILNVDIDIKNHISQSDVHNYNTVLGRGWYSRNVYPFLQM